MSATHPQGPVVSVVLPVRDGATTLERAIDSIRRQTLREWELVVLDDGSRDNSGGIAERLSREDGRIRLVRQPGAGIVAALNRGLAVARGEFIARMDADDVSHPERLAEQVALLRNGPRLGVAGCLVDFGGDAKANEGYALHVRWLNGIVTPEEIALNRFIESPLAHPSVMFRRALVEAHGAYRAGPFPEDYELWLRWLDAGVAMAKVPRMLLTWSDWPGRLSRTDARYDTEAFYAVKAGYLARAIEGIRGGRQVWVWGAGRPTRVRAEQLCRHGIEIAGYIDIDPRKRGQVLNGRRVVGPEEIPVREQAVVLGYVAKRGARDLIRGRLGARGFLEGRDFWMAA